MSDSRQEQAAEASESPGVATVLERPEASRLLRRAERAWASALVLAIVGTLAVVVLLGRLTEMKWLLLGGAGLFTFLVVLGLLRTVWLRPLTARQGRALAQQLAAAGVDVSVARAAVREEERHHFARVLLDAAPDHKGTD